MEGAAVDVEEVRGGIHGAEVTIYVEGVEGGWAGEALGRDGLDDVTVVDVRFKCVHVRFVARLSNVRGILLVGDNGRLARNGDFWRCENIDGVFQGFAGDAVGCGKSL